MALGGFICCRGFSSILGFLINLVSVGDLQGSFAERMVSNSRVEIEKFNGNNFELWKLKMEDLLVDKEQLIVLDPCTKPTAMSKEDWDKLDRKDMSRI